MRKWVIIGIVLVFLALPLATLGMLIYTETGLRALASQLHHLERFGVHIEGVSGTVRGPLRVARFELDHPRVRVVSHDIVIMPRLREAIVQTAAARTVSARDTLVEIRAVASPETDRPPRFLPNFLRVDVAAAELTQVRLVHFNGFTLTADRVSGSVRVSPRRLRVREFDVQSAWFSAAGTLQLRAERPLVMQGNARGELHLARGEPAAVEASIDGPLDALHIVASTSHPSVVAADVLITRPTGGWHIAGQVSSPHLQLDPWLERPPFSLRDLALQVEMDRDGLRTTGGMSIPEYGLEQLTVASRGRIEQRTLHIERAELGVRDTPAQLVARGRLQFDGGPPTLDLAGTWQSLQWPLRGEAVVSSEAGRGALRGPMPYDFEVNARLAAPALPAGEGTASGSLSTERVALHSFDVNALRGRLTGSGSLEFGAPRRWTLSARASNIDPAAVVAHLPGTLSFGIDARGSGVDRNAAFQATLRELTGTLRNERVRGRGAIARDGKHWRADGVSVRFGSTQLELDGSWADAVDARWNFSARSLDDLFGDAAGELQFSGHVRGSASAPHIVADLQGRDLGYGRWQIAQLTVDGDVNLASEDASHVRVRASDLGYGVPHFAAINLDAEGAPGAHRVIVTARGQTKGSTRASEAQLVATGAYADQAWHGTIVDARVLRAGVAAAQSAAAAAVTISGKRVAMDELCLTVGAGRICAEGAWLPNRTWDTKFSGYEIPLALLLPAGADTEYGGRIEGSMHLFGRPDQVWQGEAGMRIIDTSITYRPPGVAPETLHLGTGGLALNAHPQEITLSFGVQAFTDTFVFISANLQRVLDAALTHSPLSGDMRIRVGDAGLLPLLFPDIDHAAGVLTANADLRGSLAAPEVSGRVELNDGEFDSYRVNLALRELNVSADVAQNGLTFRGSGRAGDGRLDTDGHFTWSDGISRGQLRLRGQELLVADLPQYRVIASPSLDFAIDGQRLTASGEVVIPSARIQPVDLTGVVRKSDDARFMGDLPSEDSGRYLVQSDIRVVMGDDVRVDAFGLQGRITGSVDVASSTGETALGKGELGVEQGRYEAYGQKLEIARGRLLFETSPLDDPALDIEARRKVETVEVGLNVRGTLRAPRLTFFSEPSMPQSQIVSYLLVGKPLDQVQSGDRSTVASARDTLAFQGGGLIASQLGRRFGIDEVGVESSIGEAGESNQSLVLGKFLSPRLFVSYGISLTESINTLKLRYTVSDNWIFRTEAGANQSADMEFTIER